MSIYHDFEAIKSMAQYHAKEHKVNYNVILMNPVDGEFGPGSTYEFVQDSYFNKERPNAKLLYKTDDDPELVEAEYTSPDDVPPHDPIMSLFAPEPMYITNPYKREEEWPSIPRQRVEQVVGKGDGVLRNQPCACGSGKKYKKCCQSK